MTDENLPEVVHSTPLEIPVAEFEGEFVRLMHGKLPGITLEMDYGYKRDTHLKLEIEVRVRSVTVDEVRAGRNKGDLVRIHDFTIEEAKILGAYTADELDQGVGGSASAAAQRDIEEQERELDERPEGEEHARSGSEEDGADGANRADGADPRGNASGQGPGAGAEGRSFDRFDPGF